MELLFALAPVSSESFVVQPLILPSSKEGLIIMVVISCGLSTETSANAVEAITIDALKISIDFSFIMMYFMGG